MTLTIARGIPNVTAEWVPLKRVPHRHNEAAWRVRVVRKAWSMGIAKKTAVRDR